MLKNEPRHDWQDASLALKISYGPSKSSSQGAIVEEKVTVERKRDLPPGHDRPSRQGGDSSRPPLHSAPSSSQASIYTRPEARGESAKGREEASEKDEGIRKRSRFS
jgi:hypothetical protein